MQYDVYIDESGLFIETSTDPRDQIQHYLDRGRKFPSQLAAVVSPSKRFTKDSAKNLILAACRQGRLKIDNGFHATELKKRNSLGFDEFVTHLCRNLQSSGFQAARIVNEEKVSFGDRIANYTNILAEFLVRICRQLQRQGTEHVSLNVFAARVRTGEDERGVFEIFNSEDYLQRINEYFARAIIANGWSGNSALWKIESFKLLSAREDERLWVADVLSNVSHDDFATVGENAAAALKSALLHFNWTLSFDSTLELVADLAERQAYSTCMVMLAERALADSTSVESRESYTAEADRIAKDLYRLPLTILLPQLRMIIGWLQQVSERRGDLKSCLASCNWIEQRLCCVPGCTITSELESWLKINIATCELTACNHDADTVEGRRQSQRGTELIPLLAGRWEYTHELMQFLIAQAVHFNDCFEHEAASRNMKMVVEHYQSLGSFFSDISPELFPSKVQSDLCGRALGTWVQSQTHQLLADKLLVNEVRKTSDLAIMEFSLEDDKRRQYQYRSEVEAIAGNWDQARFFLSKSMGIEEYSHLAIARGIKSIDHQIARGFALLHWTRIGGLASSVGEMDELECFVSAFDAAKFRYDSWCEGKLDSYPGHGILRRLAVVYAVRGDKHESIKMLKSLNKLASKRPRPIFMLLNIVAQIEAGIIGSIAEVKPEQIVALIGDLQKCISEKQPSLSDYLEKLTYCLGDELEQHQSKSDLKQLVKEVGY